MELALAVFRYVLEKSQWQWELSSPQSEMIDIFFNIINSSRLLKIKLRHLCTSSVPQSCSKIWSTLVESKTIWRWQIAYLLKVEFHSFGRMRWSEVLGWVVFKVHKMVKSHVQAQPNYLSCQLSITKFEETHNIEFWFLFKLTKLILNLFLSTVVTTWVISTSFVLQIIVKFINYHQNICVYWLVFTVMNIISNVFKNFIVIATYGWTCWQIFQN